MLNLKIQKLYYIIIIIHVYAYLNESSSCHQLSIDQSVDYYWKISRDNCFARSMSKIVLYICSAFYGGENRKILIDFLHLRQRDETKGRTTGSSEIARVRHSRTPAPPPDRGLDLSPRGPLPAPDIISPPPIPCPIIRNPGAPTAHLFMSCHFSSSLRSLIFFLFPSLAHSSFRDLCLSPVSHQEQILHSKDIGRIRPNSLFAIFRKYCADANMHAGQLRYHIYLSFNCRHSSLWYKMILE